jgi:hypothetical protein
MRHVMTMTVVAFLLSLGTADAQVASAFEDLPLQAGRRIAITDEQGEKVTGRFASIAGDRMRIGVGSETRDLPLAQILRIEKVDDLKNGMWTGLAIGAGLFIVEAVLASADGFELNAGGYAAIGGIYAGLGAGIGAGIDALVGGNKTIYRRGSTERVTVTPTLRRGGAGVSLAVGW